MSSNGEMKMSLRLMTLAVSVEAPLILERATNILVPEVLQELELTVCSLRQDRSAKWLHDLLHGDGLAGELILGRAVWLSGHDSQGGEAASSTVPDKTERAHAHGLQVGVPSIMSVQRRRIVELSLPYLLVISKVVPNIWARTNSAMVTAFGRYTEVRWKCGGRG